MVGLHMALGGRRSNGRGVVVMFFLVLAVGGTKKVIKNICHGSNSGPVGQLQTCLDRLAVFDRGLGCLSAVIAARCLAIISRSAFGQIEFITRL